MGSEEFSHFLRFFSFFFAFLFFFVFLRFSSLFSHSAERTRANNCNLLQKRGISLRPRLHRPRAQLPEFHGSRSHKETDMRNASCQKRGCEARIVRRQKWEPTKWGFGVAMLPVGALCFHQAHFGRTVLPKWPFWAHLFYSVFHSVFRVWEDMLPPGACRMSHASARRIVSCRGLCASSLCSQIPLPSAATFGAFR